MSIAFLDPLIPSIAAALIFPVVTGVVKRIVDRLRSDRLDVTIIVMGQKMSVQVGRDASHEELNRKFMEKINEKQLGQSK